MFFQLFLAFGFGIYLGGTSTGLSDATAAFHPHFQGQTNISFKSTVTRCLTRRGPMLRKRSETFDSSPTKRLNTKGLVFFKPQNQPI